LLESEQWEAIALDGSDVHASHDAGHEAMPGMPLAQAGAGAWRFYAGVSAAKRGDADLAERFAADLGKLREQVAATNEYGSRGVAIQEKQVLALAKLARGDRDAALALAKEAADIELTTSPPSGPPGPMKPAFELYGEVLLTAGRAAEAVQAFERALLRTPKRTPSLAGLGAAAAAAGDTARARRAYGELAAMPGAAAESAAFKTARAWLAANPN
jgi:tetratricopeptide (TPR) repeat protein